MPCGPVVAGYNDLSEDVRRVFVEVDDSWNQLDYTV